MFDINTAKEVSLSEVNLDQVSGNEIKTVFVPIDEYNNAQREFNENNVGGVFDFETIYEILFSVYVMHEGQLGVLCFMFNH